MAAIAVVCSAATAQAQSPQFPEPDEQGLTLTFGWSPGNSGLGGAIGYTGSLAPDVHIMPYVGVGAFDVKRIHDNHETRVLWGPGGGVLFMHGGQHRLVLDVTYGIVGQEVFSLHGFDAGVRSLWGIGTLMGYAYVTQRGFMVRGEVGPSFEVTPYTVGNRVDLQVGLVLGYTFR